MIDVTANGHQHAADVYVRVEDIPRWIPVTERLPELEAKVLVAGGGLIEIGWREHFANYAVPATEWTLGEELDAGEHPKWITHWMPLPEPPEAR
jgi:hypothetical protein